jgi:hypothetical protein
MHQAKPCKTVEAAVPAQLIITVNKIGLGQHMRIYHSFAHQLVAAMSWHASNNDNTLLIPRHFCHPFGTLAYIISVSFHLHLQKSTKCLWLWLSNNSMPEFGCNDDISEFVGVFAIAVLVAHNSQGFSLRLLCFLLLLLFAHLAFVGVLVCVLLLFYWHTAHFIKP